MVTSTINPLIPVANTLVEQSGPALRQNFLAAYNDINALLAGGGGGGSGTGTVTTFGTTSDVQSAFIPNIINSIYVHGFAAPGDGGANVYQRVSSIAPFAPTITSSDGAHWQVITPSWPVHVAASGILPYQGGTPIDNEPLYRTFSLWLKSIMVASDCGANITNAFGDTTQTCTITIADPAVITVTTNRPARDGVPPNPHRFNQGMQISFNTTGSLPAPLVAGKRYYIQYGTVTPTSFQISDTGIFGGTGSQMIVKGTPISTLGGSQSGTHSFTVYGQSWTDVVFDPGMYYHTSFLLPMMGYGFKKIRLIGYGAKLQNEIYVWGDLWSDTNSPIAGSVCFMAPINSTQIFTTDGATTVTLANTPANAAKFFVNSWVVLMSNEVQTGTAYNWNCSNFEFAQVRSVDAGAGTITFYEPIRNNYRSTAPVFETGHAGITYGPGTILQMTDAFDQEIEFQGFRINGVNEEAVYGTKSIRFVDCEIDGWGYKTGPFASMAKDVRFVRCVFHNMAMEIDKMMDYLEFSNCDFDQSASLLIQSTTCNTFVINSCRMYNMGGNTKNMVIRDSFLKGFMYLGTALGSTERLLIENSYVQSVQNSLAAGAPITITQSGVSFAAGTIKVAPGTTMSSGSVWNNPSSHIHSDCPLPWAVPGAKMTIAPSLNMAALGWPNLFYLSGMMTTFTVLDVYTDGSGNYCVDTDMASLPTSTTTCTGTISGNVLNVTAVTPSDSIILYGATVTGGTLPAAVTISGGPQYPPIAANALGNYNLTSSNSIPNNATPTTYTFTNTPLRFIPHMCPRLTIRNCTGGKFITEMQGAPSDIPVASYFKKVFHGMALNTFNSQGFANIIGNLKSWEINVTKVYTGSAGTFKADIYMIGFKNSGSNNLYPTVLHQAIDLKTAGVRTITATTTTGSVGADSIAAVPFWLCGGHTVTIGPSDGGGDTMATAPRVQMTAQTDQGIDSAEIVFTTPTHGQDEISDQAVGTNWQN